MPPSEPDIAFRSCLENVQRAKNRALLIDYDGTIAPFHIRPEATQPYPDVCSLAIHWRGLPQPQITNNKYKKYGSGTPKDYSRSGGVNEAAGMSAVAAGGASLCGSFGCQPRIASKVKKPMT